MTEIRRARPTGPSGASQGDWTVTLSYDETTDTLHLYARKEGTRWNRRKSWEKRFPADDINVAIEAVVAIARNASMRRLI